MEKIQICKWCQKDCKDMTHAQYANHVRWCKENPKRSEYIKTTYDLMQKNHNSRYGEKKQFKVKCQNCNKEFSVYQRQKLFPQKKHYFCSKFCSHSYSGKLGKNKHIHQQKEQKIKICPYCNKEFLISKTHPNGIYCSRICFAKHRQFIKFKKEYENITNQIEKKNLLLKYYRNKCQFTFSLNNFPNEFDFQLIKKYGWYAAKNHGNNLNGVSRDHMFSVKEGFLNNINPIFISHPANCRLIRHKDNVSKLDKSLFSKEQLLKRIIDWDIKYGKFNINMNYEDFEKKYEFF